MKSHSPRIFQQQHYKHAPNVPKSFGLDFVKKSQKLIQQFLHHKSKTYKTTYSLKAFQWYQERGWRFGRS